MVKNVKLWLFGSIVAWVYAWFWQVKVDFSMKTLYKSPSLG